MAEKMMAHWVERLKPPDEGRVEHFDSLVPGLLLRVTATGKKSWYLMYRARGDLKRRRKTLGTYPQVGLADAREQAKEFLLAIGKGADPDEIRREERRQDELDGPYFKDLAADFIEKYAKVKKRTWKDDEWLLGKELLPVIGSKKAKMVKRREIIDLITSIHDRGAPVQANRTLALVRKIYNWAIERDILETSPCFKVKAPGEENERDRVLSEDEIKRVWKAFEAEDRIVASMFKLRLLTAQRGGEVESMRWVDLDLKAAWWTIPADRAKNGLSHRVPLAQPAVEVLKALKARDDLKDRPVQRQKYLESPWVFPSPSRKGQHIANIQKAAQRVQETSKVDFVMHDLRRTAASMMASKGVPRLVISKILNHIEPGVTRVYDRHTYDAEKRAGLDAWSETLAKILSTPD